MSETERLVAEIEDFLRAVPMAETTFGRKSVNDGKLLGRLRATGSVTLEKASQIRRFMAEHKASGSARPAPSTSEVAA